MSAGAHAASLEHEARDEAEQVERSRPFRWLVRAGFVARAVTYGVLGGLTVALALGAGTAGTAPNQQGALALLSRSWAGEVALVVIAIGLLAYAIWKLTQGILGWGPEGGASPKPWDRFTNAAGGLAYVVFFLVAARALATGGGSSSRQTRHAAAGVLGWPGGPVLVGLFGAVLIGVSAYQVYDGLSGKFSEDSKTGEMSGRERRTFELLGGIGITARALVFALVGYFLVRTAIDFDPRTAVGVDGALGRLHNQPLGPALVGLVAAGLLVFAAFSLFEARFRRL